MSTGRTTDVEVSAGPPHRGPVMRTPHPFGIHAEAAARAYSEDAWSDRGSNGSGVLTTGMRFWEKVGRATPYRDRHAVPARCAGRWDVPRG